MVIIIELSYVIQLHVYGSSGTLAEVERIPTYCRPSEAQSRSLYAILWKSFSLPVLHWSHFHLCLNSFLLYNALIVCCLSYSCDQSIYQNIDLLHCSIYLSINISIFNIVYSFVLLILVLLWHRNHCSKAFQISIILLQSIRTKVMFLEREMCPKISGN